jgi:chemotaxis signal transduction protein
VSARAAKGERVLAFEVGGVGYALPIRDVLEVADFADVARIPTLPASVASVMSLHGDALPLVGAAPLLDLPPGTLPRPEHALVIAGRSADKGVLALPVDRVRGLAEVNLGPQRGTELVIDRLPIDGRIVSVLDAGRLVARAAELIEQSAGVAEPARGGTE